MSVGQKLLDVPFAEMVSSLGLAIAEAQNSLDKGSIEILRIMGDSKLAQVNLPYPQITGNGEIRDVDIETSMIGAGFQPVFYQFAETIIEVKMTISTTLDRDSENKIKGNRKTYNRTGGRVRITSTPIDATYSSKYNFTQEGSSTLRTRLVPIPPNNIIQQFLDLRSQLVQNEFELEMKKAELALEAKEKKLVEDLAALEKNK